VLSLLITAFPIQSLASNGLFFNYTSSNSLIVDYKYYRENYGIVKQKLNLTEEELSVTNKYNQDMKTEVIGLKKDKIDLKSVSEEFKNKYIKTNEQLLKEQENKPSRLTWFGAGFISAVVVGILTIFAIK
jgi:hypothetical protein